MTTIDWIIFGVIAAVLLGLGIWKIVEFCRLTKEQKIQIVKQWLIAAVVAAEAAITTPGAGQEKLQMVMDEFNKKAPLLCRIILWTTNNTTLTECIEDALAEVKKNFGDSSN
jgi:hypothetical protein